MKFKEYLTESQAMTEDLFIILLRRLKAPSGGATMAEIDEELQKKYPGVEPWKWVKVMNYKKWVK